MEKSKMKIKKTMRGFLYVEHDTYSNDPLPDRLIGESSAIGDYEDSLDIPGSSYLWIGSTEGVHHLNREQVKELIGLMQHWLDNKRLPCPE